jgi:hypothetical protein
MLASRILHEKSYLLSTSWFALDPRSDLLSIRANNDFVRLCQSIQARFTDSMLARLGITWIVCHHNIYTIVASTSSLHHYHPRTAWKRDSPTSAHAALSSPNVFFITVQIISAFFSIDSSLSALSNFPLQIVSASRQFPRQTLGMTKTAAVHYQDSIE